MLEIPNVSFWFFTTLICGFIGAIDWLAPVPAVIGNKFTGVTVTSVNVLPSWKYLSLILYTKYAPVPKPVALPS